MLCLRRLSAATNFSPPSLSGHRLFCLESRQVTDNLYKNPVLLCKRHHSLNVHNHNNWKYLLFFVNNDQTLK